MDLFIEHDDFLANPLDLLVLLTVFLHFLGVVLQLQLVQVVHPKIQILEDDQLLFYPVCLLIDVLELDLLEDFVVNRVEGHLVRVALFQIQQLQDGLYLVNQLLLLKGQAIA